MVLQKEPHLGSVCILWNWLILKFGFNWAAEEAKPVPGSGWLLKKSIFFFSGLLDLKKKLGFPKNPRFECHTATKKNSGSVDLNRKILNQEKSHTPNDNWQALMCLYIFRLLWILKQQSGNWRKPGLFYRWMNSSVVNGFCEGWVLQPLPTSLRWKGEWLVKSAGNRWRCYPKHPCDSCRNRISI